MRRTVLQFFSEGLAPVFLSLLTILRIYSVLGDGSCEDDVNGKPADLSDEEYLDRSCCKVTPEENGFSLSRFHCDSGCCGESDNQHCCMIKEERSFVIGFSIFGVLLFVGLVILFVCIFHKMCRTVKDISQHKKILKEVYSARTLDELFVPALPLESAPDTIVHPMANVNGPSLTMEQQEYDLQTVSSPSPQPPHPHDDSDDDDREENWTQWDGYPVSHSSVTISSVQDSTGSGQDNPSFHADEHSPGIAPDRGRDHPFYYENLERYSQPPPGYEEATRLNG